MNGPNAPANEFAELLRDEATPALLRKALELFMAADPQIARDAADKLDELCERRLAMQLRTTGLNPAEKNGFGKSATDLNELCDAVTARLMKYLGKLRMENERFGASKLVLFAAARSFICTSASVSGVDEGLSDARTIFEQTMKELAPMLREMPETVI